MPDNNQRSDQRSEQRTPPRPRQLIRTAENRYSVDKSKQPPNTDYQWKRVSIWGKPDEEHQINMAANGWTPVPADRHPELAGLKATKDQFIVRGGQMLMERGKELTQQARLDDKARADEQIKTQLHRVGHESRERGYGQTKARYEGSEKISD